MRPLLLSLAFLLVACPKDDPQPVDTQDEETGAPGLVDADDDGYLSDDDCDDGDRSVNPGSIEICDSKDNDCDDQVDEGVTSTFYADGDGDGYGDPEVTAQLCHPETGWVQVSNDCDDTAAEAYLGHPEICDDGLDNDCDGQADGADSDC